MSSRPYQAPSNGQPRSTRPYPAGSSSTSSLGVSSQASLLPGDTCYVLGSLPPGAFIDLSRIKAPERVKNVVFTQNVLDPRTGRPMVPTPANQPPKISEDVRFEKLGSPSPKASPPRPRSPSPQRFHTPRPSTKPSPTSSTKAQASSPLSAERRYYPEPSPPRSQYPRYPRRTPPREESPEEKSPSSTKANPPSPPPLAPLRSRKAPKINENERFMRLDSVSPPGRQSRSIQRLPMPGVSSTAAHSNRALVKGSRLPSGSYSGASSTVAPSHRALVKASRLPSGSYPGVSSTAATSNRPLVKASLLPPGSYPLRQTLAPSNSSKAAASRLSGSHPPSHSLAPSNSAQTEASRISSGAHPPQHSLPLSSDQVEASHLSSGSHAPRHSLAPSPRLDDSNIARRSSPRDVSLATQSPRSIKGAHQAPSPRPRLHSPPPKDQPPRRSSRLLQKNAESLNQPPTVDPKAKAIASRAHNKDQASKIQASKARKVSSNVNTTLPVTEETLTHVPSASGATKRKRVASTTTDLPKPKIAKTHSRRLNSASQSSRDLNASVSGQDSSVAEKPRVARSKSKLAESRACLPEYQTSMRMDETRSNQNSDRLVESSSTHPSKRKRSKKLLPHQPLASTSSSAHLSGLDSVGSSPRFSRRLQLKRAMNLSRGTS